MEKHDNMPEFDWQQHQHQHMKNWRAWGSWFSWGSPVGLALFYAIIVLSTGAFIWLMNHK